MLSIRLNIEIFKLALLVLMVISCSAPLFADDLNGATPAIPQDIASTMVSPSPNQSAPTIDLNNPVFTNTQLAPLPGYAASASCMQMATGPSSTSGTTSVARSAFMTCNLPACSGTDFCRAINNIPGSGGTSGSTPFTKTVEGLDTSGGAGVRPDPAAGAGAAKPVAKSTAGAAAVPANAAAAPANAAAAPANAAAAPAANADAPSADSSGDADTCSTAETATETCCNNPTTANCGVNLDPPIATTQAGMNGTCQTGQNNLNNTGSNQYDKGKACMQKIISCQTTCNNLAQKYTGSVQTQMLNNATSCGNFSSTANTLSSNSLTASQAAQSTGSGCTDPTGAAPNMPNNPNALNQNNQNTDPTGCLGNPTGPGCLDCTKSANFNAPTCQTLAAANKMQANIGKSGFASPSQDVTQKNLDVGTPSDGLTSGTQFQNFQAKQNATNVVPSNPGQWASGNSNGGSGGRNQDSGSRPSPGSPGYSTDIERGLRSGGGGGGSTGTTVASAIGGIDSGGDRGPASEGGARRLDLKQYLPGGHMDPNRRPGGLGSATSGEIGNRSGDVWKNITNRFQEKCRLGELIDCH